MNQKLAVQDLPLEVVRYDGKLLVVGRPGCCATLPLSHRICDVQVVSTVEQLHVFLATQPEPMESVSWPLAVRVEMLSVAGVRQLYAVLCDETGHVVAHNAFSFDCRADEVWRRWEEQLGACRWAANNTLFVGPDPVHYVPSGAVVDHFSHVTASDFEDPCVASDKMHVGVVYGSTATEAAQGVVDLVRRQLAFEEEASTRTPEPGTSSGLRLAVLWPAELPFPVNIHAECDEARKREHTALGLPKRKLLSWAQRSKGWLIPSELRRGSPYVIPRNGHSWEKKLVANPHQFLRGKSGAPGGFLDGPNIHFTSGTYEYYHYRVDGSRDDGWGCAYRSLQTLLSWFQYAGWVEKPMPSLRLIQEILSVVDPEKMNRKGFVGSQDWIGSFEVMLVLQHYVPGLECTLCRLERGDELELDEGVKRTLVNHFQEPDACPLMIGGSNYAHTILGVDWNPETGDIRLAVLDPHYSSNETDMKAVQSKGWLSWKQPSKFFNPESWYNICIPRVSLYDPR